MLFGTLDQVQDDMRRGRLIEADAQTLANTLVFVQAKALVNSLADLVAEAKRTLSGLKTWLLSTLLLMRKHQVFILSH